MKKITVAIMGLGVVGMLGFGFASAMVVIETDETHKEYVDGEGCLNTVDGREREVTVTNSELRNYHGQETDLTRIVCDGEGEDLIEPRVQNGKNIKRIDGEDKIKTEQDVEINVVPGFGMVRVQNYREMEMDNGNVNELEVEVERSQ